uniref:Oxidoreductase-like domain-containing protein n=1 Tax=Glossina palpalis gambiensis TaxID=67801 RepID=A0A1B0BUN0_9MUSC
MYPSLSKAGTSKFIVQVGSSFRSQILRVYADKVDDIKLPPEPTTCCMSGCANCVWIEYAQTLVKLLKGNSDKARDIVLSKIEDPNLKAFLAMELRYLKQKMDEEKSKADETRKDPKDIV